MKLFISLGKIPNKIKLLILKKFTDLSSHININIIKEEDKNFYYIKNLYKKLCPETFPKKNKNNSDVYNKSKNKKKFLDIIKNLKKGRTSKSPITTMK